MSRGFSRIASIGFTSTFRPWMAHHISGISITGLPAGVYNDVPLICVANHTSWWDGFLLMEIRRRLRPTAPFHTVMLESQLRKSPFLRYIGAIGIDPSSPRSILRVRTELMLRLRERPDSFVFYFPQGRIWPARRRPLGFNRGIERFVDWLGGSLVLPVGIHIEPLTRAAPHAFLSVGVPIRSSSAPSVAQLERAVEEELDAVQYNLDVHGEDAIRVWPDAESQLQRRRAG